MTEYKYTVEYYTRNLMIENAELLGPYGFSVVDDTLGNAIVKAVTKLCVIGFASGYFDVHNARIIDPENKSHQILRESSWLVDFETGEKLSDLEKKTLSEKQ